MFTALKHRNNPIAFNWSLVRKKLSFVCGLDRTKIAFTTKVESVVKRVLNCASKLLNLFDRVSVGTNDSEMVKSHVSKYVRTSSAIYDIYRKPEITKPTVSSSMQSTTLGLRLPIGGSQHFQSSRQHAIYQNLFYNFSTIIKADSYLGAHVRYANTTS